MTESDFQRLESKVDKLTDAITQLVRVEERQIAHAGRLDSLDKKVVTIEESVAKGERKLDSWINRGIGVWAVVLAAWTIWTSVKR